jgi:hypothetical protein
MRGKRSEQTAPGMAEAMRALRARPGRATEADRPRRRGSKPKMLPGQLDVFEILEQVERENRQGGTP